MKYLLEIIFIIGIIALIATIIKYPKDITKGILRFLSIPFLRVWDLLTLMLFPFGLLIIFIEDKLGLNYLTRLIDREPQKTKQKTKERKQINFQNFKKYIVVNSTSGQIKDELTDAAECCPTVNLEKLNISRHEKYSVVETPMNGFYGYNFLIQWLTEKFKPFEIVGFASNGRTSFLTINNSDGDNDLVGRTNLGRKFWISMYDDLDKKQFLRLNDDLEVNNELTTEKIEKIIKNAI